MSIVFDTEIYTDNGKALVKDIRLWDKVLTYKGRFKEISHIDYTERKSGIYELKIGETVVRLSSDHCVLTKEGWVEVSQLTKVSKLAMLTDDYLLDYVQYDSLEKLTGVFETFDFTVLDDHSVVVNGLVIHN